MTPSLRLTDDSSATLTGTAQLDGVVDPVLLGASGRWINEVERKRICKALGLVCPRLILDADNTEAAVLLLSLTLARRHDDTGHRYDMVTLLRKRHLEMAAAAGYRIGDTRAYIVNEVNADLAALDESFKISQGMVEKANCWDEATDEQRTAVARGEKSISEVIEEIRGQRLRARRRPSKAKRSPAPRRNPVTDNPLARIQAIEDETSYQSMLNAQPGNQNNPFMRRAIRIQQDLDDVSELTPEKAASHVMVKDLGAFPSEGARWWLRFTELCEQRREAEAPEVPVHRVFRAIPLAQRDLTKQDWEVLSWLRNRPEPVTAVEAARAFRAHEDTARRQLGRLVDAELAEIVGRDDRRDLFRAVTK
jgi:hypothetical protein